MYFFLNESKIVYYSFKYNFHADSELITFKNLKFEEENILIEIFTEKNHHPYHIK